MLVVVLVHVWSVRGSALVGIVWMLVAVLVHDWSDRGSKGRGIVGITSHAMCKGCELEVTDGWVSASCPWVVTSPMGPAVVTITLVVLSWCVVILTVLISIESTTLVTSVGTSDVLCCDLMVSVFVLHEAFEELLLLV